MWLHHRHAGGQRFNHVKAKRLAKLRRHGKHGERFQKRLLLRAAEVRMKFHITQQRLGVQAIAQAFYKGLIAWAATAADLQAQLRDMVILLHFDEGIDQCVEALVLAHARKEPDHRRIGRHALSAVAIVIDAVVNHSPALVRQVQFFPHATGIKRTWRDELINLLRALGHDLPDLLAHLLGHAVDVRCLVLQQTHHRRANGFLEPMRQP